MVTDNQDWEYCSVHMSVQKLLNEDFQDTIKIEDYKKSVSYRDSNSEDNEQISSLRNTLSSNNTEQNDNALMMTGNAVEFTSMEIDLDIADEIEVGRDLRSSDKVQNYSLDSVEQEIVLDDKHGKNLDIDIFFPSLLLSFESLLNRVFDDLINGIKNHDLYSMGLAQYLKLEDEQVNGNEVKLRYRLPIDNVKLVFEAMSH